MGKVIDNTYTVTFEQPQFFKLTHDVVFKSYTFSFLIPWKASTITCINPLNANHIHHSSTRSPYSTLDDSTHHLSPISRRLLHRFGSTLLHHKRSSSPAAVDNLAILRLNNGFDSCHCHSHSCCCGSRCVWDIRRCAWDEAQSGRPRDTSSSSQEERSREWIMI